MGQTKNLFNKDAIRKIREMAMDVDIAMFCTNLGARPFNSCPMSTQQVEDDGTIWFLSAKDSDHNADLAQDGACQLIYSSKVGETDHLSLFGNAEVTFDRAKAEELFDTMEKAWFPGGIDDPNFSMIRFTPSQGYYWDTKHGKMISFAKMMASIVTGSSADGGVSGKLEIS